MNASRKYFVLEEEIEKSFSTVPDSDVICDEENVSLGDQLTFFWNKKEYVGKVCHMDEDFDICVSKARTLNGLRKLNSVDEKQCDSESLSNRTKSGRVSRKTSRGVASYSSLQQQKQKVMASTSKVRLEAKKKMLDLSSQRILKHSQKRNNADGSETHHVGMKKGEMMKSTSSKRNNEKKQAQAISSSSSASESEASEGEDRSLGKKAKIVEDDAESLSGLSELDEENEKLVRLLAAKLAAKRDLKKLQSLAEFGQPCVTSKRNVQGQEGLTSSATVAVSTDSQSCLHCNSPDAENNTGSPTQENATASMSPDAEDAKSNYAPKTDAKSYSSSSIAYSSASSMFCVPDPTCNPSAQQLLSTDGVPTGIYCLKKDYDSASNATSSTMAGRRLLTGVFTIKALSTCSLTGLPPRGKGKSAYSDSSIVKKDLDQNGVDAIVQQALQWQNVKRWRPKKDCNQIRNAMGVRLCEISERQKIVSSGKQIFT